MSSSVSPYADAGITNMFFSIFSLLGPEDLETCSKICKARHEYASNPVLYTQLASQMNFFAKKPAPFEADPKREFIKEYSLFKKSLGIKDWSAILSMTLPNLGSKI